MVRLDTILEIDANDDHYCSYIADQSSLNSKLGSFQGASPLAAEKKIDDFLLCECRSACESCEKIAQAAKRFELVEPECELDPCGPEVYQQNAMTNSEKIKRGRRHSSLITKAFKLQKQTKSQEAHPDSGEQSDPAYIWMSDLAADWSRHFNVTSSSLEPVGVKLDVGHADVDEIAAKIKRNNRKKSLIDKAASQQRKDIEEAKRLQVEKQQLAEKQQKQVVKLVRANCPFGGRRIANGCDDTLIPFAKLIQ